MKHFVYFKFGRYLWEKLYEYHGDLKTARQFQLALSKSYNTVVILCEVI